MKDCVDIVLLKKNNKKKHINGLLDLRYKKSKLLKNHIFLLPVDRDETDSLCRPFMFLSLLLYFNQNPLGYL